MQRRLRERTQIHCPVEQTEARVLAFFESRADSDGATRLKLRVPIDRGGALQFSVERDVRVEVRRSRDERNLNDELRIAWSPEGTAVLPRFEGSLVVWGGEDPALSLLELDGNYVPPMGSAGQLFDETIGRRIAQVTARELLDDIKRWIEARHAE